MVGSNSNGPNSNGGYFRPWRKGEIWGPENLWKTLPVAPDKQLLLCPVAGLSVGLRAKEI